MTVYYRPLISDDPVAPVGALRIAGGWAWATHVERIERARGERRSEVMPVTHLPEQVALALSRPREAFEGQPMDRPQIMGILNTTPDSFSDGGLHLAPEAAVARVRRMRAEGADLIDVGGESTRPGADTVEVAEEIARTAPVIRAISGEVPVSIDTRKASVAQAALDAGARAVNDVSALGFDPDMGQVVAKAGVPVVLMHAQGSPKTMQDAPSYEDVLLDVYDALDDRIAKAEAMGIPRARIMADPGIGFGKTIKHNLALLSGVSLFHGLGCPILLGASRKRFIGTLTDTADASDRVFGSVAVALSAISQGVQMVRVHDTLATKQALTLWQASRGQ